jgi:hypothetical protein
MWPEMAQIPGCYNGQYNMADNPLLVELLLESGHEAPQDRRLEDRWIAAIIPHQQKCCVSQYFPATWSSLECSFAA